jgi:ATP-dependent DNA helicase RecG
VPEGKRKPYSTKGKFYLRYGANSQQLKREDIRHFFQDEGLVLFDEKPNLDFNIKSDFNESNFKIFLERTGISPVLKNKEILENLRLLKDGYMKNAGVLLFSNKITDFFLQATITCVLYRGKTKYKILDRKEYDGNIYSNYENSIIYLQSKLNTEFIINAGPRKEKLELPEEALREAILNAVAHRDYFVAGANILIEIYSDRIEITNPGGLVKGMRIEDLGKKSLSRNNLLFGLMQRMDLVEKVGSGIIRMQNAMKEYGFSGPKFDINDNWFTIIFKRPEMQSYKVSSALIRSKFGDGSEKSSEKILFLIRRNQSISAREIAEIIGISRRAVEKHIANLKEIGKLKRNGPAKGGNCEVVENDN